MEDSIKKRMGLGSIPDHLVFSSIDEFEPVNGKNINLQIPKDHVLRGHIESYLREFKKFEKKKLRSQVAITFTGYNNDAREIYQIREIRNWMHRLFTNVPHLFYFLCKEDYVTVYLCFMDLQGKEGEAVSVNKESAQRLIEKIVKGAVSYSKRMKEPIELQFNIAEQIMAQLGYDQAMEATDSLY